MTTENTGAGRDRAVAASRADRDRTLQALHRLETSLAMAAGGDTWLQDVIADIRALEVVMREERQEMDRPDGLMAMLHAEHPRRFGPRIRNLYHQYDDLLRQVGSLEAQLTEHRDTRPDAGDLRQRCGWLTTAVRHCRALQTDLVYEALDLELGDTPHE